MPQFNCKSEYITNGLMKVEFIRSKEQLGGILTKPVDRVKFLELHAKIGLIDISEYNKT
jgi:hypothetical protein